MKNCFVLSIMIAFMIIPMVTTGQSCTDPAGDEGSIWEPLGSKYIGNETWTGPVGSSETLIVNGSLTLRDCTLTMEGGYVMTNENATLTLINSTVISSSEEKVYYIDIRGEARISNSTIWNALDISNGYFGIYIRNGPFRMESSDLSRSGMLWFSDCNSTIVNTVFEGSYHEAGSHLISESEVITMGVSVTDGGSLVVNDTDFTSNISFSSGAAAISATGSNDLILTNVDIEGTYNAGIFASFCTVKANNVRVDLAGGIYGLKFDNCSLSPLKQIEVLGCDIGISFIGCSGELEVNGSFIDNAYYGVLLYGPSPLTIDNSIVNRSVTGVISYGPVTVTRSRFVTNGVCISVKDNDLLRVSDTRFESFEFWGIMAHTWDEDINYGDGNIYIRSEGAMGDIALYGMITVRVVGPDGISVEGAQIWLHSPFGTTERMGQGDLEVIWGYLDGSEFIKDIKYTANSSWLPAVGSIVFTMGEGLNLEIPLPLVDVWLSSMEVDDDRAVVDVKVNGTGARANIAFYIDGRFFAEEMVDLSVGEGLRLEVDLPDTSSGEHTLTAEVEYPNEWDGHGGILQDNNKASVSFFQKEDTGDELLLIYILAVGSILLFTVPILLRRKK